MRWNPLTTYDSVAREARRIQGNAENMAAIEIDAFSSALYEIASAVAMTQPYPVGCEFSLSVECITLFRQAAAMAEAERKEHAIKRGLAFMSLPTSDSDA